MLYFYAKIRRMGESWLSRESKLSEERKESELGDESKLSEGVDEGE